MTDYTQDNKNIRHMGKVILIYCNTNIKFDTGNGTRWDFRYIEGVAE